MKHKPYRSALAWILLVLGFAPVVHAQMLSGRVYEGTFTSEPPTAHGLADVVVTLYGSNNSGTRGLYITSTTTGSDGWYGLGADPGFEFYTIVSGGKTGYSFQGSNSVSGAASGEEIVYVVPLDGKTLTGNKFWYASDAPASSPPVANDDSYNVSEGSVLTVAAPGVMGNDSDSDGDPLTAIQVSGPSNGTLTLNSGGSFTYTPNVGFSGNDSFTYRANDGLLDSNVATVNINVEEGGEPPQGTGTIRGTKFNDLDGDGQRDPGEPGLFGWQIALTDDTGTVIAIAATGVTGVYEFGNMEPGAYSVDEIQQSGWRKTYPEVDGQPALWSIGLEPDSVVDDVDFGNVRDETPPGPEYEEEHGDAPQPYVDFYVSVSSTVLLGSSVDGESAMQRDPHALGDDNNDGSDDEDGVEFVTLLVPGQQATIRIDLTQVAGPSFAVSGHIDFDRNGNWDTGESVIQQTVTAGIVNTLTFAVPATAQPGATFARFYIVDQGPEPPWGIPGGEIEDYEVIIVGEDPDPDSQVDVFGMCLYAEIDVTGVGVIRANLSGPATQRVSVGSSGQASDSDLDGLDDVAAELIDLNLTASDPVVGQVHVRLTPGRQTSGQIEERTNNTPGVLDVSPYTAAGGADAYFDLYLDIELPDLGLCFRVGQAIRIQGTLSHVPPAGSNTYSPNVATPLSLFSGPCGMAWPVSTSDPPDAILLNLASCGSGVPDDPAAGSVTIVKRATPADDTRFAFCTNFAPGGFFNVICQDLQDPADPQWILADPRLIERVTEAVLAGWTLKNIIVTGDTDQGSTIDLSQGSVDVDYDPGENIVIVFENEKIASGELDYADAPASYGSAWHVLDDSLTIGSAIDAEAAANYSPDATGDDLHQTDDEDGVTFSSPLTRGALVEACVDIHNRGATGRNVVVGGWIDFNGNGMWDLAPETIGTRNVHAPPHSIVRECISFAVPQNASLGSTIARFRLIEDITSPGVTLIALPTGGGGRGEVEDYQVEISETGEPGVPGGVGDFVWIDTNRNGLQEAGEPGIANIWVDIHDQSGTPWQGTATDASGKYTIVNLPPGLYYLDFQLPAGYAFTGMAQGGDPTIDSDAGPTGRTNVFAVSGGQINSDIDAGMYQSDGAGEIRGVKWNDSNGNRMRDAGEPGLANWRIILDLNQDGVLDSSPLSQDWIVSTNANGEYRFVYYFVGSYIVGEELQSGWQQTFPNSISGSSIGNVAPYVHSVTLSPGQTVTDIDFGNSHEGVADTRDYGDAPSSYGIASADVGGLRLGTLIDGESSAVASVNADGDDIDNIDDEDGVTVIGDLVPGQNTGLQISLTFPSQMPTKSVAAWVDFDGNGAFQDPAERIALVGGNVIGGAQFAGISSAFAVPASAKTGTTFMRVRFGAGPGSSLSPTGHGGQGEVEDYQVTIKVDGQTLPPGEIFGGYKFNDLNGNGQRDAGEPGLANWTMWIDLNGNGAKDSGEETLTNPDGSFFFTALLPGTYTIHEEMQSGWVQTHPGGTGIHTITVQTGQPTVSVAFGNRRTGSGGAVHGYKWNDLNASGIRDVGEPWLVDWTFWLDINNNGRHDAGDVQAQTDAIGHFRFADVPVGTYLLGEQLQSGWVQTAPGGPGTYTVTVQSGQGTFPMMFGNRRTGGEGQELDWGDAPDPSYPTMADSSGASHTIVDGFHLGANIDAEANGQPSSDAQGDNRQGLYDEDGIFFITPLMPGQQATVEVAASADGLLDAWIDFDADGGWGQASDRIFASQPIQSGPNVLQFQVPAGTVLDVDTYARFRFSSGGALRPDGPAADGEVEDYHILLGPEGPGAPGEFDVPHVKWSQPPVEIDPNPDDVPVFCSWGESARSTQRDGQRRQWRMVVDDFRCLGPVPITRIRWWGSYKGWESPEPPELQPVAWHIGFWANTVEGLDPDELYPERLVWDLEVPTERVNFEPVGLNEFPNRPLDTCFRHELVLEPHEWFHQAEFAASEDIFWISITAVYPPDVDQADMWGWNTRSHTWGRGAMMPAIMGQWPDRDERLFPGRINPVESAELCGENQAYDLCFELLAEQPWSMWDQPFASLREWPHCEDQESYAVEADDGNVQIERRVADDWLCERPDPIVAISWHGSYIGYGYEACKCDQTAEPRRPDYFIVSMRTITDDPAGEVISSELVWEYRAYDYDEVLAGYDCNPEGESRESVFRYSVRLPEEVWFRGQVEQVYWLGIVAVYGVTVDEIEQRWGWTNRPHILGSTAQSVSFTQQRPLREPLYDRAGDPVDMSFSLFTMPGSPLHVGRVHHSKSSDGRAAFEPGATVAETSDGAAQINPDIAVDGQGIIHVVWEDYAADPSLGNIMYANSDDGGHSFGESVTVDDAVTVSTHQARPQIALDDDGIIHVVWEDYRRDPRLGDIYYSKSTDGGRTFGDDVLVDDPITVTSRQINPAIAVDGSGGIHVVWEDYRDNAEMANIYHAASADGGQTFGMDKRLNEVFDHATDHGRPTIVADSSGTLYVFWEDYRNAPKLGDIYCSLSTDGGKTFGRSRMVDDPITVTSRQIRPAAVVDGGIVYVVWEDYRDNAERGNIYSARSLDGGRTFEKDVMVDSPITTSTHQANPAIAVIGDGLVQVVWEDYRDMSEHASIYYSASLDGGRTFGEDLPAAGPGPATGSQLNPAIAVDRNGAVHLVWQQ